jgi:hypothetical protein
LTESTGLKRGNNGFFSKRCIPHEDRQLSHKSGNATRDKKSSRSTKATFCQNTTSPVYHLGEKSVSKTAITCRKE